MTVPSWMFVRAPIRIEFMSPRTRQWNQIPVSEPITTSPMIAAVGAINASAAMIGVTPSSENTVPGGGWGTTSGISHLLRGTDTALQPEHQADVLHRRA